MSSNHTNKSGKAYKHDKKTRPFKMASKRGDWDDLPIAKWKSHLVESVRTHATTVIVGETGSGKSTQLPKFLAEAFSGSNGCVICTQPRRVAAVTVAQRVASEMEVEVGAEVGYSIRFEDKTSPRTKIKFVTDGVLLRECMVNSDLDGYDVVILDEAHERSLSTDILMGLIKEIQARKPNLKLVVMSATLQVDLFMSFFADTNLIKIEGRQHPVTVMYTKEPEEDYVDAALRTCAQIHSSEAPGGVLVFLPGQEDIENLQVLLEEHLPSVIGRMDESAVLSKQKHLQKRLAVVQEDIRNDKNRTSGSGGVVVDANLHDFEVRPLYAAMPPDQQLAVFEPPPQGVRKFILSTNIAETSVTISGIKYVVDAGYFKCKLMEATTGVEMLKVTPVSQAQANQRAGRAGREAPGKCFRVFTESAFEGLAEASLPEIQRVSIAQVVLQLLDIGVKDPKTFLYPSPPMESSLSKAGHELFYLGALDNAGALTAAGKRMASLPLEPVYSALLLRSADPKYHCVKEMLTIVSMLSADNIFLQPHREAEKLAASKAHKMLSHPEGDLPTLLNIYTAWSYGRKNSSWASQHYLSQRALLTAANIRDQLTSLLQRQHSIDTTLTCYPDEKSLYLKCLAAGLCLQVAQKVVSSNNFGPGSIGGGDSRHIAKTNSVRAFASVIGLQGAAVKKETAPYVTMRGRQPVYLHPSSVLFGLSGGSKRLPEFVVYSDLLITTKQYMRGVTAVDGTWLEDLPNGLFKKRVATTTTAAATAKGNGSDSSPATGNNNSNGSSNGVNKTQGQGRFSNPAAANRGAIKRGPSQGNYIPESKKKKMKMKKANQS
jgi:HrpA-like RNA helicase